MTMVLPQIVNILILSINIHAPGLLNIVIVKYGTTGARLEHGEVN